MERLEDEPDRPSAEPGAVEVVERGDVDPDEVVGAGGLTIEETDDVEQRRLPRTGRSDDRDPLARADRQVDVTQRVDGGIGPEGTGDAREPDDRYIDSVRDDVASGAHLREVDHGGGTLFSRSVFCSRKVASKSVRTLCSTSAMCFASHLRSAATMATSSRWRAASAARS